MANKKFTIFILFIFFILVFIPFYSKNNNIIPHFTMPIVKCDLPYINFGEPIGRTDASVLSYLQCSVRVRNGESCGSGTMCYFDYDANECYIISCGHLFANNISFDNKDKTLMDIDVFYKNNIKLSKPQSFKGYVICTNKEYDISLIKFNPDWKIEKTFHIAPSNCQIYKGQRLESTGCDYAGDPASYTIEMYDGIEKGQNLISRGNSPRPGRSGGGVFTSDGYFLIGIARATSSIDGSGYGFYTPVRRIHEYLSKSEKTSWLLRQYNEIDFIPMIDKDRVLIVPPGYIPFP